MTLKHKLPYWFYIGLFANLFGWVVSWSHIAPWTSYMFIFIWGGFILVLDGINYSLKSSSLLTRSPRAFVFICLLSSLFWWYFEFVNLLTRNWYYIIDIPLTPLTYQFLASLYFTTVIPVIFELTELIHFKRVLGKTIEWIKLPEQAWMVMLMMGVLSILLPILRPDVFFPLIWLAPGFLIEAVNYKLGFDSLLEDIRKGDWTRVFNLAIAALIIGMFWEMWNLHADPKWVYAIPYLGFFKIFEMPILGFLGYLPFGWAVFSFYAFVQGVLRYPNRQFFAESEYSFRPRLHRKFTDILLLAILVVATVCIANIDIQINGEFHRRDQVLTESPNAIRPIMEGEKSYTGVLMTCHYAFVEGRCLYSGVGETYLLTDAFGDYVITEPQPRVRVVGVLHNRLIGLPEIRVSRIVLD